ncbi:MAG: SBBP repeat-containing protein [Thermoplasmata archaeon]|nr:MAG: SBBP repeat-containing protein [Thermoplasmata archaeon]
MQDKVFSIALCALMFTVTLIIEAPMGVSTQVTEEWVARYNSPENLHDSARAIAIDSSGNIFVTGYSRNIATWQDYLTIAYDSSGNELWVARYNGPENRHDRARDIAVNSSGIVYVTGDSDGNFGTIAYDSAGNELWVARYDGGNAVAIVIGSSGNVYVTGRSCGNGTGYDYATVVYDSSGSELWVARYNGPGNGDDVPSDMAIDSSENIYVAGAVHIAGTNYDYATVGYDSSGNELWVARYNSLGNGRDNTRAITTDLSGNVYVTGTSDGDYATVAYDSSGNELWVARYNGLGNGYDVPWAIVTDSSGNVYVTGDSYGNGTHDDYATVAYDSSGNELWVARYNGPGNHDDHPSSMAVDPFGNVYVTGKSYGGASDMDYATVAYDSLGNELWVKRYNSVDNRTDRARDIAVDSSGNVYVTGYTISIGTSADCITIKYSQEPFSNEVIIDIDPNTLNLKSKGKWITCYIELPKGYDVRNIDATTILLEDSLPPILNPKYGFVKSENSYIMDHDNDSILERMVKFDRSEVEDMLSPGIYNLKITGELVDGTEFEGYSDEVKVIEPP